MNKKQVIEMVKKHNITHIIDLQYLDMIKHKKTLKERKQGILPFHDTRVMLCMSDEYLNHINDNVIEKLKTKNKDDYYRHIDELVDVWIYMLGKFKYQNEETQTDWSNLLMNLMTEFYLTSYCFNPRDLAEKIGIEYDKIKPKDCITLMSFWSNKELNQVRLNPKSYNNKTLSLRNTETEYLFTEGIIEHINKNYSITDKFCFGYKNKELSKNNNNPNINGGQQNDNK